MHDIEKDLEHFKNLYCKDFKELCNLCQPLCEDGNLDCVKCSDSIQITLKE